MTTIDTSVSRRPYHHSTPSFSSTPQLSPTETILQTPEQSSRPLEPLSKHSELASLAMPPKDLFLPQPQRFQSLSPPQTPKGHPLDSGFRRYTIANPYAKASIPYHLPRRLRPFVLLTFCVFVFGLVYLNQLGKRVTKASIPDLEPVPTLDISVRTSTHVPYHARPAVTFADPEEELAALISFVTSTTANTLHDIDPAIPLDPAVVLDFDPGHPNARDDLDLLIEHVNTVTPLVLFGKMRDPWHREIQKILADYRITPALLIIDVDQRRDHRVFIPLLERLLGTPDLPQLVIQGHVLGSYHQILDMRDAGTLTSTLEASGLVIRDAARRKGVKERERWENERILQPAPIVE